MNSHEITEKWALGTLERGHIYDYLIDNVAPMAYGLIVGRESVEHIADMCHGLYGWSRHNAGELGDFLLAIADNNWSRVCMYADDCNRQYNWMIHIFLYNCAPTDWQKRRKVQTGKEGP